MLIESRPDSWSRSSRDSRSAARRWSTGARSGSPSPRCHSRARSGSSASRPSRGGASDELVLGVAAEVDLRAACLVGGERDLGVGVLALAAAAGDDAACPRRRPLGVRWTRAQGAFRTRPARDAPGRLGRDPVSPEPPPHPIAQVPRPRREIEAQAHAADHHLLAAFVARDDEVVRCAVRALPGACLDPLVHQLARVGERQALQHPHHPPIVDEPVQRLGVLGARRAQAQALGRERSVVGSGHILHGQPASSGSCR